MKRRLVFDLETDGFLDKCTAAHCATVVDVNTGAQWNYRTVSAERDRLAERLSRPAHAHLDGEHMNGAVDGCLLCQAIAERDQLRSQLAEYENAPTVAWQDVHEPQDLYHRRPVQVDVRELIARKVKK